MLNNKLAFIMIDGLRYDAAVSEMGYMHHLVEKRQSARFKVKSELPSMSRPLYEVLLTGTPVCESGITTNQTVRLSHQESLFHLTKKHGLTNAAAAYYWVSELYNRAPFRHQTDRFQLDESQPIEKGIFYWEDHYPDSHLFTDAHSLMTSYKPDFLYVHSMNVDDDGHRYTGDSIEYRSRVIQVDTLLGSIIPAWVKEGYQVIVTADHGMNKDGMHGGTTPEDREVPLFIISEKIEPGMYEEVIPQLQLAPLACHLLQIPASDKMQPLQLPGIKTPSF